MNFSKFFITRPIFAAVLSLVLLIAGSISLFQLPISEYPEVVPPTVVVRANFPGANPKVIAETVASPLEEQINGVENMLYMQSQANSDGNLTITVKISHRRWPSVQACYRRTLQGKIPELGELPNRPHNIEIIERHGRIQRVHNNHLAIDVLIEVTNRRKTIGTACRRKRHAIG